MSKYVKLGDIAKIYSGGTPSRLNQNYWGGKIPWLKTTQIQNCIITEREIDEWITEEGLKKSSAKLVPKGTIVIAMIGQGKTRGQVAILDIAATTNQNAAAIELREGYNKDYVYQQLLFRYKEIRNISNSSGQQNLNLEIIKSITFPQVTLSAQIAIGKLFTTWDQAIKKIRQLIATKGNQYIWLISNLILNNKHHYGHIRDFTSEISRRNNRKAIERVLSVTNDRGFLLPEDQFERSVASSDLSNYKVVTHGQYAYNPSRINVGSIARLDQWDNGVLSPMYVVFEINEQKVNSDYFLHWLESHEAKQRIRRSAQGSVRETVSFTDLGAIPFPLPSLDKQITIVSVLNTAQQEINLLKKQLDAYRNQKRGLMQKLLTGQWRVKAGE